MTMKTAESDNQKQQGAGHESAPISSPSAPTSTLVAAPTTASEEGLQFLVQARLSVSSPNDPFEHEAESMADEFVKSMHGRTVSAPTSSVGSVARSVPDNGLVEGGGGLATTDDTASAIMSARAGGQALSGDVRSRFEGFFGADLGGVKIHNDGTSDNLCRSINAEAFTTGNDVFFSSRSFKPGSSSGDHLLAHELTHVVQQGNAPALSRRALPDIQREWWNPFADKTRQKAADGAGALAVGKLGTAINGGVNGQTTDTAGNYIAPDLQPDTVKASATTGGALSIVADTAALLNAIIRLYTEWNTETTSSVRDQLVGAVKSALSVCQGSTTIAASASATLVAFGALPALGIAYATIDLAQQAIKIHETRHAKSSADVKIKELKSKGVLSADENKLLASLTNLAESAEDEYIRSSFRLSADIISISGQITLLATSASGVGAIAGGVLVGIGAGIQGLVLFHSKVSQWMSSGSVLESRYAVSKAEAELKAHEDSLGENPSEQDKARTKELKDRVDDLAVKNLGLDAYAAAAQLIKYSAGLVQADGELDPEGLALVGNFNISATWMKDYVKGGSKPEVLDKGARLICEFVGKAPNAQGLVADLKAAASYVANGLKWAVSGGYWVLTVASKVVVSLAVTPFALLVGLFGNLTGNPQLGYRFIDAYASVAESIGSGIEDGASAIYKAVKKKVVSDEPKYFSDSLDVQLRTSEVVLPIITNYFNEKADRGTDVKPGTVTSLLKPAYKTLTETSKASHPDGSQPFTSPTEQMVIVDNTVKVLVRDLAPERVKKDSVVVEKGQVDFKYVGSEKAKTKGWFAGLRGREAVED
jgi:hypothetical protein